MRAAYNRTDLVGQRFGCLTVASGAGSRGDGSLLWACRCDCGGGTTTTTTKLRSGHSRSCGCSRRRRGLEHPHTDRRPVLERLAERSTHNAVTGCREWSGSRNPFGHGTIRIVAKVQLVHRVAWEAVNGKIPAGLDCLHRCDNPPCWNVDHLFLGTQADNNADRDRKGRHVALRGQHHGMSQLSEAQARAIKSSTGPAAKTAAAYGVSEGHVYSIRSGRSWGHI